MDRTSGSTSAQAHHAGFKALWERASERRLRIRGSVLLLPPYSHGSISLLSRGGLRICVERRIWSWLFGDVLLHVSIRTVFSRSPAVLCPTFPRLGGAHGFFRREH